MLKKIIALLNARGLKGSGYVLNTNKYLEDSNAFSWGGNVIAILIMILMGPKKYFKMVYSRKGIVSGLILGVIAVLGLLVKNIEIETK